ncbi:MAG TPA: CDP-alcohol phosphatidyltransferase family protein [Phycisphaerales bacterium]|nr:CDP-alcohol phosphatidyltransferase family protein [Phycisphaerales bacterium]HRQ74786.1 CDP-alcohol phosphatidyltransferase family protein [Phycisphaerales bacterium]
MSQREMGFRRHLPNALTVLRLFIAAGFFLALNQYRFPSINVGWANLAIVLFIAAALTDMLDGYLARRWKVESVFGRLMDPFCDKVLVLGAFIYLAGPRFVIPERVIEASFFVMATGVYSWMVVIIFARELLVTSIRGSLESMGMSGEAIWAGKAKMILQSVAIPVVIFIAVNIEPHRAEEAWKPWAYWAGWFRDVLVYVTVIVTVWSGWPYVMGLRRVLARRAERGAA